MPDLPSSANKLGRYEVIREIARSNDIIYEAIDPVLKRRVALKELNIPPNLQGAQRRERIERFYREAKAAGTLTHPNIVTIYEVGEDNDRHYISMEFLEGQNLRDRIDAGGPLPIQEALDVSKAVLSGLEFAHSRGIIHRDIKPDNIQLLPNGGVKITDFGIARIVADPTITADGQVFGTPSYMSPEQVAGGAIDARTDIFSFGIVLYEMLTGQKPFTGDSVITITYNIMHADPRTATGLPFYLEQVIRRALAKDPNARYASAAQMQADLDRGDTMTPFSQPLGTLGGRPMQTGAYQPPPYQPQTVQPSYGGVPPIVINVNTGGPQPIRPTPMGMPPGGSVSRLPDPIYQFRPRRKQVMMPAVPDGVKALFKALGLAILISGGVLLLIFALMHGYEAYKEQAGMGEALSHNEAGLKLMDRQDYRSAITEFDAALELAGASREGKKIARNLAQCHLEIAKESFRQGDYTSASDSCDAAIKAAPDWTSPYLNMGLVKHKQGYIDEAVDNWRKVIELDPTSNDGRDAKGNIATVYVARGDYYLQQGDTTKAREFYTNAIEIGEGTDAGATALTRLQQMGG